MLNSKKGLDSFQETVIENMVLAYMSIDFRSSEFIPFTKGPGVIQSLAYEACNTDNLDARISAISTLIHKRFKFEKPVKRALENITQLDPRKFLDIQLYAQYVLKGYYSGTQKELGVISRLLQAF